MPEADRLRVGSGWDVHAFERGRPLILGGVQIPHDRGLRGHSDADVLTHAVIDALLGAAAAGDIGRHFPDRDPRFKGADSIRLLERVRLMLTEGGWRILNVDATVMAEEPRILPYHKAMRDRLSSALGISRDQVSVKATTCEGLGFIGRREGIAAQAVCLLHSGNTGVFPL